MAITVKLEKNIFGALATKLQPRKDRIMRETRVGIVAMARTLVPIDTGRLYQSIRATFTGVEADTEYAGLIEYGAPPFRAPQPYLMPAVIYYRPIMIRRLREELFAEKD